MDRVTWLMWRHAPVPHDVQALRVSVGKLGILGRVKLHIVPEVPVRR